MLELLVGLPGSGKSTYARQKLAEAVANDRLGSVAVVSFDAIRREVFGCGYRQEVEKPVYELFERQLHSLLEEQRRVIVDNMNLRRAFRDRWAHIARQHGHKVIVTEFQTDSEKCWWRVLARGEPFRGGREGFDLLIQRREEDRAKHGTDGADRWIEWTQSSLTEAMQHA